jgi:hypothetical protein
MPALRASLARGFVEEDGGGGADVERIHFLGHRYQDGFIALGQYRRGDAVAFAAEDDAAVAREIGLGERFFVGVGMGGDAADAVGAELAQGLGECQTGALRRVVAARRPYLKDGNFEDRAHGVADGAAEPGAGACFADNEGLGAEGDAVAHEEADVFGIGQSIDGGEQAWRGILPEKIIERIFAGDLADGEDALEHLEADEGFEEFFIGKVDGDVFRARGEERLKFRQAGLGQDDGLDGEPAFEEALDDFIAFSHEDALGGVFGRAAKGAVGGEPGQVEGGDGLDAEHGGKVEWGMTNEKCGVIRNA